VVDADKPVFEYELVLEVAVGGVVLVTVNPDVVLLYML
jgi:hypothetical protein